MSQTKAELRTEFLAKRKALSADELTRRNDQLTAHFIDFFTEQSQSRPLRLVHTFLPIRRQNEVDTWPIIRWLWQRDVDIAISVSNITTNQLTHYPLTADTPLIENKWGIPEPINTGLTPVEPSAIDLVLVPLLAFDRHGHRVGYGKGYYDRFLADCRPDCLKVGLSLFEPVEQIADVNETDVPLDDCLAPNNM
ncbi:5-formyltetrahydrofolate cyclo-ligase [Spirosoma rhododendri]|uniref:5-formyltetrahydrofolate cyclo-ligase n=1 Tax=Spirosoma rhododendri TaxID=2728024 RepID=A0A7L5DIB0_9BACT|nr:5-formyltetrahydrofolate cyclo-ligase [Spirosoma rhododendri]QJD78089.1 5-formyltetrahydrofolate cyclo-ligase [Spirosoma rhododendri]